MMIGVNDSGLLYLARNEHIPPLKKGTPSSNFLQEGLCQVVWRVKIQTHATPFEDGTSPSSGSLWCPSDTPVAMMQWTFLSFCMWCVEIWNGGMGGGSFLDDGWGELLNGSTTSSTILHGWVPQNHATLFALRLLLRGLRGDLPWKIKQSKIGTGQSDWGAI